jgi:hypothetical protein
MARSRNKKNQRYKNKQKQSTEPPFKGTCCGIYFNNRKMYLDHARERHPWTLVKGL